MKTFAIVTNELKDPAFQITNKLASLIHERGSQAVIVKSAKILHDKVDAMLVLGGDGTMLQAARETAGKNIPMIGVNLGTLGYLAEVEIDMLEEAVDKLLAGEYELEERMMLCGKIRGKQEDILISPALNDMSITRSGPLQIIFLRIYVNGKHLCDLKADGIIVSTPTGSTGYNMSAGGPIVEPGAELILISPVCAHTLNARSIVLRAEDVIEIEVASGRGGISQMVDAYSDGSERIVMETGEKICIYKAKETTTIIKLSKLCFLEVLHKKMADTSAGGKYEG